MDFLHDSTGSTPINLFARLVNGETKTLTFFTPQVSSLEIKTRLFQITKIPVSLQRLIHSGHQLTDDSILSSPDTTIHLCLRLRGGKGGFGSLLRGAATKAGQKKTNNFDACRDMSGRRLRHVNAEKKLEEWKAEEEERRLEKIAEEFLKKTSKNGKKGAGDGEAQKYVAKYREESAKCVQQVEMCVKEAIGSSWRNGKRRAGVGGDGDSKSKKLKIWMGKRKRGESDSDDSDENGTEDEEENEKSTVLNNGNDVGSNIDREDSPSSVTGGKQDGEISAPGSSGSHCEEDKDTVVSSSSAMCTGQESVSGEEDNQIILAKPAESPSAAFETEVAEGTKEEHGKSESAHMEEPVSHLLSLPCSDKGRKAEPFFSASSDSGIVVEPGSVKQIVAEDKPLNFEEFNAAEDMEVLGMERLKVELQTRGLKCGGTLQERAARLFLLKSTPLDKIPKKHLAKK